MQPHIWVRAEQRDNEQRVGITPKSVSALTKAGFEVSVEHSSNRAIPISQYENLNCEIVEENSWPDAPSNTIIFGLKELSDDGTPLTHRHIFFGHAFKGQAEGPELLRRFAVGGGTLYDLEYLIDKNGNRVTAFSYWAGLAGAAVGLKTWAAQQTGQTLGPISAYPDKDTLLLELKCELNKACKNGAPLPTILIIGALGKVGTGATDLAEAMNINPTKWDMEQTASGGPFPEILDHTLLINCILASPDVPVFVPKSSLSAKRKLSVIADIACDPNSSYNPIPIYNHPTSFTNPVIRITNGPPPLDITAIDNLPSMLPTDSSNDFATQLLPYLLTLDQIENDVWGRAKAVFDLHMGKL